MARVELQSLSKVYPGGVEALASIDLTVEDGQFLAIVGPSGSGKSTLLRIIAGLETGEGAILIDGEHCEHLPPSQRDLAMVFQNPALMPHLSVFENIAFGLRRRRYRRAEIRERVESVAELLGLTPLLRRSTRTLSGGERQRVAMGRALARRPKILLLDEPMANLDAPLRASIRNELLDLHNRLGMTTVLVTHDQAEALALGQAVAVFDRGRIMQVGTPEDVYERPSSTFVASFLGSPPMNLLPCSLHLEGDETVVVLACENGREVRFPLPDSLPSAPALRSSGPGQILLGLRPEHITLADAGITSDLEPTIPAGDLIRTISLGHERLLTFATGCAAELTVRRPAAENPGERSPERLALLLRHASWFDAKTGLRVA